MNKFVIIGAGAAGLKAAETIRKGRKDDSIIVISPEKEVYSKCLLHYYLSNERKREELTFVEDDFFEKYNINWLKEESAEGINIKEKYVYTNNYEVGYDKLLISTGSKAYIPPIGDLQNGNNVFTLRTIEDVEKIREKAKRANNIVIIGAGLIGLDTAYGLIDLNKRIKIIEQANRILPLQLDYEAGIPYKHEFERNGCQFEFNVKVADTEMDDNGKITCLVLNNNERVPCDLVIVAVGSSPIVDFLDKSGLRFIEDRLLVNAYLQTSNKDIYAAGDVTSLSGIWPNARRQGEIAAKNMIGDYTTYLDIYPFKNNMNFFGILTLSIGEVFEEPNDDIFVKKDSKSYRKIIVRDNKVVTAILQGDLSNIGFWQYLIKNEVNIEKYKNNIWDLSYVDFFSINKKGEFDWEEGIQYQEQE